MLKSLIFNNKSNFSGYSNEYIDFIYSHLPNISEYIIDISYKEECLEKYLSHYSKKYVNCDYDINNFQNNKDIVFENSIVILNNPLKYLQYKEFERLITKLLNLNLNLIIIANSEDNNLKLSHYDFRSMILNLPDRNKKIEYRFSVYKVDTEKSIGSTFENLKVK